jgi:hypothetical protein
MLYHMVKFNNIPGSRAMQIIINNISHDSAEDVLALVLNTLVPVIIDKYLPIESTD